jgi:hypothetical protein
MYQRALQGYEKAWSPERTSTLLFERQGDITKARTMYSKAFIRNKIVFGPDHPRSQSLRDKASALDVMIKNKALIGVEEPIDKETLSKSKRYKLFRKLGLR